MKHCLYQTEPVTGDRKKTQLFKGSLVKSHDPKISQEASPHIPQEAERIKLAAEETLEAPEPWAPSRPETELRAP